jgi:hypothetical protein
MATTVTPDRFLLVDFDADLIGREADEIAALLGIDRPIVVNVDESTFLARVGVTVDQRTIRIDAESGAFEDTKRPRQQSADITRLTLAKALLRARDRLDGSFAEAPPDDELTMAERAAWSAFVAARLARLGLPVVEQRSRYDFRNRHGFTDAADAAFERLWSYDDLDWPALRALSTALAEPASSAS